MKNSSCRIILIVLIGLCNSVMGWKRNSTNHNKALTLITMAVTFYIWAAIGILFLITNIEIPHEEWRFYIIPSCSLILASMLINLASRNKVIYKNTLLWFKSLSPTKSFFIKVGSVIFVFASIPLPIGIMTIGLFI